MELMYASTRDANEKVTASQAILKDWQMMAVYMYRLRFRLWM